MYTFVEAGFVMISHSESLIDILRIKNRPKNMERSNSLRYPLMFKGRSKVKQKDKVYKYII